MTETELRAAASERIDSLRLRAALWLDRHASPGKLIAAFLVLVALVLLVVVPAFAADVTVTWTPPTQNTDGSAIPASGPGSLTSTRVEWGSCVGTAFGTTAGERTVNAPAATTTITGLAPGTHCFRAYARNTYGVESLASGVASRTLAAPTPNPPTAVTVALFAYELRNGKLNRVAGLVERGTRCEGEALLTLGNRAYHAVPRSAVWPKPRAGKLIVAQCAQA